MKERVLFIVNVDWFFLSHRLPIALEAKQRGYEVHVATVLTDRLSVLHGHGFVVHPLVFDRSSTGLWPTMHTCWQMFQVLRQVRPDLVHLVTIKPVLLGGIAARLVGVPSMVAAVSGLGFVFVEREGIKAWLRRMFVVGMYRVAMGHPNLKVIFQNSDDLAKLVNQADIADSKVELIPGSGVDLGEYRATPLPSGMPVVMLAARLLADKGVYEFVQAARLLRQSVEGRYREVRFVLVGTPDPGIHGSLSNDELKAWVAEGIVEYFGHSHDMPRTLSIAHIVVLPSYYREGLPKVLIEAAACGRAVVTTDFPGCRDAIVPNETGLLIPVRDAEALAQAIRRLLDDSGLCSTMGQAGRTLAECRFDVRQVVERHLKIYAELLAKKR
ncbi:MAG: glycosyltransferase family 4 protein [Magnetococcales bacterium]|nr:glycosyltransferase family 4 protein [Magnetococcales bacterium]MBF0439531.1 glycosyltransferase family 4 protein [Magnetococcales bacterium]